MSIIDTHTHLYEKDFDIDRDIVIKNAIQNGVHKFFIPCTHRMDLNNMFFLEKKYPNICKIMIGLHPIMVNNNVKNELFLLKQYLKKRSFSAIGEIGIDFTKKPKYFVNEQFFAFNEQISWAKEMSLPIIIHSRYSFNEVINIIKNNYNNKKISGIFHCFCGSLKEANIIIKCGLKLGIGGIITFKNCKIDKFLNKISLEHIVLETDSPYLSPHPFRGKRNEPSNIIFILKKLSQIYCLSIEEISKITTKNANDIFIDYIY